MLFNFNNQLIFLITKKTCAVPSSGWEAPNNNSKTKKGLEEHHLPVLPYMTILSHNNQSFSSICHFLMNCPHVEQWWKHMALLRLLHMSIVVAIWMLRWIKVCKSAQITLIISAFKRNLKGLYSSKQRARSTSQEHLTVQPYKGY